MPSRFLRLGASLFVATLALAAMDLSAQTMAPGGRIPPAVPVAPAVAASPLVPAASVAAPVLVTEPAVAVDLPIFAETMRGRLSGSLLLPTTGVGKPPVVLIVSGSGPTDRDGNTAGAPGRSDCLKLLARALSAAGIASVRFDKRGVGASRLATADPAAVRFSDLADDVASWLALLKADARLGPVIVLGHDEGALLAMLAAQKISPAALVSLAAPAGRASDMLRAQLTTVLPDDLRQRSDEILGDLELGQTVSDVPAPLMGMYRPAVQPYLISWFRFTPTDELARLKLPVLIAQGSNDLQVNVDNADLLRRARPDAQVAIIDGMNHVLKTAAADPEGQRSAYLDPSLPISPGLVGSLLGFVRTVSPR